MVTTPYQAPTTRQIDVPISNTAKGRRSSGGGSFCENLVSGRQAGAIFTRIGKCREQKSFWPAGNAVIAAAAVNQL
jgi:hypothetical protein